MDSPVNEVNRHLVEDIRAGSPDAPRRFLERYQGYLLGVIRQKLNQRVRKTHDSGDLLQDVLKSFFTGGRLRDFQTDDELLAYVRRMTKNKVDDVFRKRCQTVRYNQTRERSLQGSARAAAHGVAAGSRTPCEIVMSKEEWDRVLGGLEFHHRQMIHMLGAGHTYDEVAEAMGVHPKTVQRLVEKVRGIVQAAAGRG
jgi:RNA polymerase sigma factor (sigma-70 family)